MARRRIDIEALVQQHGVTGLAKKVGVHRRTVVRWRHDAIDPSPLALEKLKGVEGPARRPTPAITHGVSSSEERDSSSSASTVIPSRRT